ncbi:hypothetical protein [Ornithinimicrobium flavum]|uniref:hypothetical protein n=1 Tax=Ornithinimicrobium flavum TaxID=1288636 RepID=UPI00106FC98E|nr:hypothetical protein [Ornithinimicrobium flavum]
MRRVTTGMTCLVLSLGLTGCIAPSGFETVGRTGVASVEGDLAVVWDSCGEEEIRSVVIHADREGLADDEENPEVGRWEMGERNREEKVFVPSAADDPPQLDPSRGYIVQALPAGEVENLPAVHFTLDEVAGLGPGEVLIGAEDGSVVGTMDDLADC